MNKNIITPVDLIQTLREAADSLDQAAFSIQGWGGLIPRIDRIDRKELKDDFIMYRNKATAIRNMIKEFSSE